jgi:hypothetical protein
MGQTIHPEIRLENRKSTGFDTREYMEVSWKISRRPSVRLGAVKAQWITIVPVDINVAKGGSIDSRILVQKALSSLRLVSDHL